jgi:Beta galactosidase small chain
MPTAADRYSTEALVAAKHDFELQQDSCVHVHLDHRHMGVGGDDSWTPSVHEVSHVLPVSLWQLRHPVDPHNTRSCCRLQW